jgi:hypothetical protein
MKPPNMAPLYVSIWERATEVARECGYALAVHGTLGRDLDLIACPWTDAATSAEDLAGKMAEALAWQFTDGTHHVIEGPKGEKPHGRRCFTFPFMAHWFVDLSVMPRLNCEPRTAPGAATTADGPATPTPSKPKDIP